MRTDFSTMWKSSKQPRKQRKYRYNAPLNIRGKFLGCHLSKDLREKHGTRSVRVRKGDKVKVLKGKFKGREEKVERVSLLLTKIYLAKIEQIKKDGSKTVIPFDPSNLMIVELDTSDKKRLKHFQKSAKPKKEVEKPRS